MAHFFCTAVKRLSESKKHRQDCLMLSTQSFYGMFAIGSAFAYLLFSRNVPLLHMSRYIIARDSVLPGLPPR